MTMIEKVARAIFDELCPGIAYLDEDKKYYKLAAKAAIEAMREPTDEMIIAADVYIEDGSEWGKQKTIVQGYVVMIDAALKED